jgi:hypothetical protein
MRDAQVARDVRVLQRLQRRKRRRRVQMRDRVGESGGIDVGLGEEVLPRE